MNKPKNKHLLCIDFESWIFSKRLNKKKLSIKELKQLDNDYTLHALDYILKILKKNKQKATFFVVFKLEELYPGIIDKILNSGHEVGWHTHTHEEIDSIHKLEKELELSKKLLQKYLIKGFQAPNLTFIKKGYPILKKYGFLYSSSIYGNTNRIYKFDDIYEIPVSVCSKEYSPQNNELVFPSNMNLSRILKHGLPIGSSFFWSILGEEHYKKHLQSAKTDNRTYNLFIHDWQLLSPNSEEYKKDISFLGNPKLFFFFILYRKNVSEMFENLLSEFSFNTFKEHLEEKGLM